MTGVPHVPAFASLFSPKLPASYWAASAAGRGEMIIDEIDRWLGIRQVWPLHLLADWKLEHLADALDKVTDEIERWLTKDQAQFQETQPLLIGANVNQPASATYWVSNDCSTWVSNDCSTTSTMGRWFIDAAGRRHTQLSDGSEIVQ